MEEAFLHCHRQWFPRLILMNKSTKHQTNFMKSLTVIGAILLTALIIIPYFNYSSINAAGFVPETGAAIPTSDTEVIVVKGSPVWMSTQQQDEESYDVVFSGGGAKGIALIGAVREMEEQGITYNRLVGTSAGTIIAVLLAVGYDADELEAAMAERADDGSIIMSTFLEVPESFDDEVVRDSLTYLLLNDLTPGSSLMPPLVT